MGANDEHDERGEVGQHGDPERVVWLTRKIKLDRVGSVEDMMGSVVFVARPNGDLCVLWPSPYAL